MHHPAALHEQARHTPLGQGVEHLHRVRGVAGGDDLGRLAQPGTQRGRGRRGGEHQRGVPAGEHPCRRVERRTGGEHHPAR